MWTDMAIFPEAYDTSGAFSVSIDLDQTLGKCGKTSSFFLFDGRGKDRPRKDRQRDREWQERRSNS